MKFTKNSSQRVKYNTNQISANDHYVWSSWYIYKSHICNEKRKERWIRLSVNSP